MSRQTAHSASGGTDLGAVVNAVIGALDLPVPATGHDRDFWIVLDDRAQSVVAALRRIREDGDVARHLVALAAALDKYPPA